MRVFLSNPYGFSKQQRKRLLPEIISKIESFGHEVWEPFEKNNQFELNDLNWAYYIGQADKKDIEECDIFFAIINGNPPDEGVMVELGIAIALKKKIYLFRDDLRTSTDCEKYPLNLMIFCGLPMNGWEKYYFQSIEDIEL